MVRWVAARDGLVDVYRVLAGVVILLLLVILALAAITARQPLYHVAPDPKLAPASPRAHNAPI